MPAFLTAEAGKGKGELIQGTDRSPFSAIPMGLKMDADRFMGEALEEARKALTQGEFPVGCVLVYRNQVVARARRRGTAVGRNNELDHAEILALRSFGKLSLEMDVAAVTAFCTMEPCLMCFSALMLHGIGAVVYAYEDPMGGGTGCPRSLLNPLYRDSRIVVRGGVRRKESLALFKAFFSDPTHRYWHASHLADYTLKQ
jgi:tRNA(adenine34) deaminase